MDPGESVQVLDYLQKHGLALQGILLTHHHSDHVGGVQAPCQQTDAAIYGPAGEPIPESAHRLRQSDRIDVLGQQFEVIDVPGHTAGHIICFSIVYPNGPLLLCGDTLFPGGYGRLFEGIPEQMLTSLDTLAALPVQTQVCPMHEYVLVNLRLMQAVEPSDKVLAHHVPHCEMLYAQGLPMPSSCLGLERQVNPFLRSHESSMWQSLSRLPSASLDDVHIFAALHKWGNNFQ